MAMAATRLAAVDPRQAIERVPRDYNFAADLLEPFQELLFTISSK